MGRLLKRLILILATLGFCYQVARVSMNYFSFPTMNQVKQYMSRNVRPVSVNICVPYIEVLDRDRLLNETASSDVSKLTIAQIFKYTPATEGVLHSCRYRVVGGAMASSTNCNKKFRVSKNYVQSFICYHFLGKTDKKQGMELITHGIEEPFMVAEFTLSHSFNNVSQVHAVPSGLGLPYYSRNYADLMNTKSRSPVGWLLKISPAWVKMHHLPFPYDTQCLTFDQSDNTSSQLSCSLTCILTGVGKLGRLPFTEFIDSPIAQRHVSIEDIRNNTFAEMLTRVYDTCHTRCEHYYRFCVFYFSTSTTRVEKSNDPGIRVAMMTQRSPDTVSETVPSVPFIEFFSFVCSCFSTWFGVSFLSLSYCRCSYASIPPGGSRSRPTGNNLIIRRMARGDVLFFPVPYRRPR